VGDCYFHPFFLLFSCGMGWLAKRRTTHRPSDNTSSHLIYILYDYIYIYDRVDCPCCFTPRCELVGSDFMDLLGLFILVDIRLG
jgi:hypothetical protein